MNFRQLSLYLDSLEKTPSRNEMVIILSQLFTKATDNDIDKICYLLQGRVVPLYNAVELGMAGQMVIEAIAKGTKTEKKKVNSLFKEKGDLGKVVQELKQEKTVNNLSVEYVFSQLTNISQIQGAGSVEKKINILALLIEKLDSLSARFLVRIPLNKLRLGFSDMTILDSLSWMETKSKEKRVEIERAYNVRPDLGFIAKIIKQKGISALSLVVPQAGTPILMARADRLNSASKILKKIGKCAIEYKYDGLRLQVHQGKNNLVKLFSRSLEDVTLMFPDIVKAVKEQISVEAIIEGEVVAYNPKNQVFIPFQQTMQRKRKYDITQKAKEIPVKLFVFELLFYQGKNCINLPYIERKALLKKIIKKGELIKLAQEKVVSQEKEIDKIFDQSVVAGFEGIIAKKLDGHYQAGIRSWNWIKFKKAMSKRLMDTFDVLVMGYTKGQGKRTSFGVGQFLTGVYDAKKEEFVTFSKIGTGLTDEQFREFNQRASLLKTQEKPKNYNTDKLLEADCWLKPKLVVEVAGDEITRSQVHTAGRIMKPSKSGKAYVVATPGFALRFPRLIRFRDDKKAEDVTALSEVKKMFVSQKK